MFDGVPVPVRIPEMCVVGKCSLNEVTNDYRDDHLNDYLTCTLTGTVHVAADSGEQPHSPTLPECRAPLPIYCDRVALSLRLFRLPRD